MPSSIMLRIRLALAIPSDGSALSCSAPLRFTVKVSNSRLRSFMALRYSTASVLLGESNTEAIMGPYSRAIACCIACGKDMPCSTSGLIFSGLEAFIDAIAAFLSNSMSPHSLPNEIPSTQPRAPSIITPARAKKFALDREYTTGISTTRSTPFATAVFALANLSIIATSPR